MTDQELLQGIWDKDSAAFDELYARLYLKFCAFAHKIIHDPVEAGDQASEAFIKLWLHKKRFASMEHVNDFLYLVIKNSCVSLIRKNKLKAKLEKELLESGKVSENLIESRYQDADVFSKIFKRIEQLPQMQQKVFKLIYLEGYSRAEAAKELGIAEHTVKNHGFEAMKAIRRNLQKDQLALVLFTGLNFLLSHFRS